METIQEEEAILTPELREAVTKDYNVQYYEQSRPNMTRVKKKKQKKKKKKKKHSYYISPNVKSIQIQAHVNSAISPSSHPTKANPHSIITEDPAATSTIISMIHPSRIYLRNQS